MDKGIIATNRISPVFSVKFGNKNYASLGSKNMAVFRREQENKTQAAKKADGKFSVFNN